MNNFVEKLPRMDIYSKPGTKVIFDSPECGWPHDQETAAKYLTVGGLYTIAETVVHSSSTEVYLKEIPGVQFNSVLFGRLG